MKMIKFTMIIPVYNAGSLINLVFESIQYQTSRNFEVIFVDDGSSDESLVLCEKFIRNNQDISMRLIKTKHLGICGARNLAIEHAKGKWIVFADHDDSFNKHLFEILEHNIDAEDFDILKYNCEIVNIKKENITKTSRTNFKNRVIDTYELFDYEQDFYDFKMAVWTGAYKKNFIIKNNIRFEEVMKFGMEDFSFNLQCINKSKRIKLIDSVLYTHYKREGISTSSKFDLNRLEAIIAVLQQEDILLRDFDIKSEKKALYLSRYLSGILNVISYRECNWTKLQKKEYLDRVYSLCFTDKKLHMRNLNVSIKRYIVLFAYKRKLYDLLLLIFKMKKIF